MQNKIILSIKGGVIATAVFSALIWLSPYLGLPRVPVWEVLADKLDAPVFVGWLIHFLIGIIFAASYLFFFKKYLKGSDAVRGLVFGLFPFVLAQGAAFLGPGLDPLLFLGSLIGHLAFGLILGLTTSEKF